ncbi:MAG: cation:proton antiporter [Candidatus Woesearchaeota archaeon]
MAAEDILIKFLVIMIVIFFIPKITNRFYNIPFPLTELLLGILLSIIFPQYFFTDDIITVLSTIGIITLFVYAGIEVDSTFLLKHKYFFIQNIIMSFFIVLVVSILIYVLFSTSIIISLLIALALTIPSASYIISSLNSSFYKTKEWIHGKAIIGEIFGLFFLIILLKINHIWILLLTLAVIIALIIIMPIILRILFDKIFSQLIGSEFSFIFVVAVISAYITQLLGIHFLVGAFVAGVVSRRFISNIIKDHKYQAVTEDRGKQIISGFGLFATVFVPFYFFSVGLSIQKDMFSWYTVLIALALCLIISLIRTISITIQRIIKIHEKFKEAVHTSNILIPTLVFTFVISDILYKEYNLSHQIYSILMLYGVMTGILSFTVNALLEHKEKRALRRK